MNSRELTFDQLNFTDQKGNLFVSFDGVIVKLIETSDETASF
jgi:hypothetical protein